LGLKSGVARTRTRTRRGVGGLEQGAEDGLLWHEACEDLRGEGMNGVIAAQRLSAAGAALGGGGCSSFARREARG
jgi:hypothetical protein